jgi:hypothetical protein
MTLNMDPNNINSFEILKLNHNKTVINFKLFAPHYSNQQSFLAKIKDLYDAVRIYI